MLEQAEEIRQSSRAQRLRAEQDAALLEDQDRRVEELADPRGSVRRRAVND